MAIRQDIDATGISLLIAFIGWFVVAARKKGDWAFWVLLVAIVAAVGPALVIDHWHVLHDEERDSVSTTIRNYGLLIGGAIAAILAVWRSRVAEDQAGTAQQSLLNERYQKGAEMLGNNVLAVRLGGIYALDRLAAEHPEQYHIQVMKLFCAFVRNPTAAESHPIRPEVAGLPPHEAPPLREDVQAVMQTIAFRGREQLKLEGEARFRLDLQGADLRSADLNGANLASASWESSTRVSMAELLSSHERTDLTNAKLCSARLALADLPNADLTGACLCDSALGLTDLSGANLTDANLHTALSWGPVLSGARFSTNGSRPARGILQSDLDACKADVDSPPDLSGTRDIETNDQLVWSGKPRDGK